jgi:hypothetical protein
MKPAGIVKASPSAAGAEIWLHGNVRPVAVLAGATLGGLGCLAAAAWACGAGRLVPPVAAAAAIAAVALAVMGLAAARPRLVRRGSALVVRLSPAAVAEVPIDVVECFFPGSSPLDPRGMPTCADHATWRVNTLVMRLAERAAAHRARRTFTPWGTWDDGYVVFDGRWCEPLSPDLARGLSRRLLDARREVAAADGDGR